jgi:hypothetical protein
MKEQVENNNQNVENRITILEHAPPDCTKLLDDEVEHAVYDLQPEELKRFSDYISKSFFEQFGIEVEIAFVKEPPVSKKGAAIIEAYLKAKELPEGLKLEELRLFKIDKHDSIHDGHYYISYDTKGIKDLDRFYGDALLSGSKGLEAEYNKINPFTQEKIGTGKVDIQQHLRHHAQTSGGINRWEVEVPETDRKRKGYLEVFEHPLDKSVENTCRELVKKAGAYIVEQLKARVEQS